MRYALRTIPKKALRPRLGPTVRLLRSGAIGGALGISAVLVELPVLKARSALPT